MSDYFPLEVILQILHRLPVKSIVRCTSICKTWKSIITNHSFIISHHHQHLQTNSSLFLRLNPYNDDAYEISTKLKGDLYSIYSDDDGATNSLSLFRFPPFYTSHTSWLVVGNCNGLLCFADYSSSDSGQIVIWNPSIVKYLILPKPSLPFKTQLFEPLQSHSFVYGFGFDSRNNDFKVVRIVSPRYTESKSSQVEIYSLAANSWRTINVAPFPFHIAGIKNKFMNGVLHWLAHRTIYGGEIDCFILTFDLLEEKFGEIMLPHCLIESQSTHNTISILTGGNLLALIHTHSRGHSSDPKFFNIWVMKEYGVLESWTKMLHFDSISYPPYPGVLALRNNEEVVIKPSANEIIFLDPIKGLVKKIKQSYGSISFAVDHDESLFLINEKNAEAFLPVSFHSPIKNTPSLPSRGLSISSRNT